MIMVLYRLLKKWILFILCCCTPAVAQLLHDSGWHKDFDKNSDGAGDLQLISGVFCRGSMDSRQRVITFLTGLNRKLSLTYRCCADKRHLQNNAECHVPTMSGLGLGDSGWYINGFVNIVIDEISIANFIPVVNSEEQDASGKALFSWNTPSGEVKIETSSTLGEPFLTLLISLPDPKTENGAVISFLCYPSRLVADKHDRFCVTPSTVMSHWHSKEWKKLDPNDFWILYGDHYWDKKVPELQNACSGPCAITFLPTQYESVALQIHNYEIFSRFVSRTGGKYHFLIWPSFNIANDLSLEKMRNLIIKKK